MNQNHFSLPLQMAIAILLGISIGMIFGDRCALLQPYATAYVMILKVTAIPYLIVAIIHGIGLLNGSQAMQILKKGSMFIVLALLINISMVYLMNWAYPAAEGRHHTGYVMREVPSLNFAEILIPQNIFYALSNNIIPAVVVFCILTGISLIHMADKQVMMAGFKTLLDALTKITSWIARITPIGTFIIMANQVGTIQLGTIKQMGTYVIIYIIGTCLVTFWVVPRVASILSPMKTYTWIKSLVPALVLAYTTTLTIVALPYIINIVQREMQMLYPKDENVQNQIQGTVSIIFNLPLGAIFTTAFVFFCAVFFSVNLPFPEQIKLFITTFLTCLGAVGLGSWINSLTFILDALGIPIDAINLYLAVVPFTAGFQSMVSVMLISTLAFLIMLAGRSLLTYDWKRMIFGTALTALPVLLIFGTLKVLDPLPRIKSQAKTIFDLEIASDATVQVYTEDNLPSPPELSLNESTLQRIFRTKHLRIGYFSHSPPFCFFNTHKKLVGFDVAYAYQLAYDMGCDKIDFIPIEQGKLGEEIQNQKVDIAMSPIPITPENLRLMCFPQPVLETKIVFVTKDKYRNKYANLKAVKGDPSLKIAVLNRTSYQALAYELFPDHKIVVLDSYNDFKEEIADILIWNEQSAIAWTVTNPQFQVVHPKPHLQEETLGFPIRYGDPEFLCYLNSWLTIKENDGFKEEQYKLWILGKTQSAIPAKRRWSLIDNVFRLGSH